MHIRMDTQLGHRKTLFRLYNLFIAPNCPYWSPLMIASEFSCNVWTDGGGTSIDKRTNALAKLKALSALTALR